MIVTTNPASFGIVQPQPGAVLVMFTEETGNQVHVMMPHDAAKMLAEQLNKAVPGSKLVTAPASALKAIDSKLQAR